MKRRKWLIPTAFLLICFVFLLFSNKIHSGTIPFDEMLLHLSPGILESNIMKINTDGLFKAEEATTYEISLFDIDSENYNVYAITPQVDYAVGSILFAAPKKEEFAEESSPIKIHVSWFDAWYIQKKYGRPIIGDQYTALIEFGNEHIHTKLLMVSGNDLEICKTRIIQLLNAFEQYSKWEDR